MAIQTTRTQVFRFTKAGNLASNPIAFNQRAAQAFSNIADGATLIVQRDENGLRYYLVTSDIQGQDNAAILLAQTVAASAARYDEGIDLSDVRHVAQMQVEPGTFAGQNTQAGSDPLVVANSLATVLSPGEWVGITVRRPRPRELKRNTVWLGGRGTFTHHSNSTGVVAMSMYAGSDMKGSAENIIRSVASGLPGFDLRVVAREIRLLPSVLPWLILTLLSAGGAGALIYMEQPFLYTAAAIGVGAVSLLAAIGVGIRKIPSRVTNLYKMLAAGLLPEPPTRGSAPKKPQADRYTKEGQHIERQYGDYPLANNSFLVGPQIPVIIVAPHAGAESGSSSTRQRSAPPELRQRVGPLVGHNEGLPVCLDATSLWEGVLLFGAAGSGKSQLTQAFYGWNSFDKVKPSGLPGAPGRNNALIAFESKGDGAYAYEEWSKIAGDQSLLIEFGDPSTWAIDILSFPGSIQERSRQIVSMMKYAFSDGSIMEASFDTLGMVFGGALITDAAITSQVQGLVQGASPFYYASVLLGQRGEELGVQLAAEIRSQAVTRGHEPGHEWREAADGLLPLYGDGVTPSQRKNLLQAPRNKVSALLAAEQWWARPNKVTWEQILQNHGSVIVNTGSSRGGHLADDELSGQVSSMLMYSLYMAIRRNCSGWQAQNRYVNIFSDELKLLAGTSGSVITWLREQGRSYGVRQTYATQYPEQLAQEVRESVMNFKTLIAFTQSSASVIRNLIDDFSMDGSQWESSDLATLPQYNTIIRTVARGVRAPVFTLSIDDWWAKRHEYAALQGYDLDTPEAVDVAPEVVAPGQPVYQSEPEPEVYTPPAPVEYNTDIQPGFSLPPRPTE